jgi:hypothetical protein
MRSKDVHDPNINIIFMTYDFDSDPDDHGQYVPKLRRVEGTSHANLQQAVLYMVSPTREAFCEQIKRSAARKEETDEVQRLLKDLDFSV